MFFHIVVKEEQDINEVFEVHKKVCSETQNYIRLSQERLNSMLSSIPNDTFLSSAFLNHHTSLLKEIDIFSNSLLFGRSSGTACVFSITDLDSFAQFWKELDEENSWGHKRIGTHVLSTYIKGNSKCYHNGEFIDFDDWIILLQNNHVTF